MLWILLEIRLTVTDIDTHRPLELQAPGVMRKSVHEPLQTGLKAIDSMIPLVVVSAS